MAGIRQHSRNLLALCGSTFFFMSSFFTTVNLQSSLNTERNLGLISLAALYASYSLSCFVSPVVIKTLNTKWTIFIASVIHCAFIAVNIYPRVFTLLPVAFLVGLSAGPLWTAQATHLTTTAINLALLKKENASRIISRFNGLFYLFYVACLIPGNMISSLILYGGKISLGAGFTDTTQCGANDCNLYVYQNTNVIIPNEIYMNSTYDTNNMTTAYLTDIPTQKTRLTLFAILLGWGLLGSAIAMLLLDPLRSFCKIVPQQKQFCDHAMGIFKLMKRGKFILLMPLIAFTSLELGFTYATFTKSYVTCSMGVQNVGFAMTSYGVGGFLAAVLSGALVKYTGRLALLTAGFLTQISLFVLMLMWAPHSGQEWQVYGLAGLCGVGGSIRLTQICAFLGVLFPRDQEAAFTAFNFWYGIAYSLYFALGTLHRVCVVYIIYSLLIWLVIAMMLYYGLEWKIRRVGFLSINDETQYEEHWQEIDTEKRTKLFDENGEKHPHSSATNKHDKHTKNTSKSRSKLKYGKGKEKRHSKLLVDEVETVV